MLINFNYKFHACTNESFWVRKITDPPPPPADWERSTHMAADRWNSSSLIPNRLLSKFHACTNEFFVSVPPLLAVWMYCNHYFCQLPLPSLLWFSSRKWCVNDLMFWGKWILRWALLLSHITHLNTDESSFFVDYKSNY